MYRSIWNALLLSVLFLSLAAGCSSQQNGAAQAVENYLKAMVAKDNTQISSYACADWESQAQVEADSFAGVSAQTQDLACKVSGQDGNVTLVACTGKIVMSYNGENQELDLSARTYKAVQEGGDWRMCGYQ
jgi:hypothetical protein